MNIKFRLLGTGSSMGVPRPDGFFGNCNPKNKKNYKTEFNWTDKTDHPIDYKELDKENKAFWIEQKKPKRQKIDDSKNGDYFTFCRNKKCNQPLYKNRSNMDTRYCMECL